MVLRVCMVGMELAKKLLREEDYLSFVIVPGKRRRKGVLPVKQWFEKKEQRKITYCMGGNETEIDFVLVGKNNRKYLKEVKAIPWRCNIGQW